jgi:holo-[acyl-carrier protein] synthase
MILGSGVDIASVERIEWAASRWGDRFLRRVFTEDEIALCRRRRHFHECLALRFAAKEAFVKAVGWGFRNGLRWRDIEVRSDSMGKPYLFLRGKANEVVQSRGIDRIHLTLSDERPYAIAHVLLERENP